MSTLKEDMESLVAALSEFFSLIAPMVFVVWCVFVAIWVVTLIAAFVF